MIMTNTFSISNEIKSQQIGFIKKSFDVVDNMKHNKYSVDLLYINNVDIINNTASYYEKLEESLNRTKEMFNKFKSYN